MYHVKLYIDLNKQTASPLVQGLLGRIEKIIYQTARGFSCRVANGPTLVAAN